MRIAELRPRIECQGIIHDFVFEPTKAANYCTEVIGDDLELRENVIMIALNATNGILGHYVVGKGGVGACHVDPKVVFSILLAAGASSVIFAHNHPSGEVDPSKEDIAITQRLIDAGKLLAIKVLDHIIVAPYRFRSMKDRCDCNF